MPVKGKEFQLYRKDETAYLQSPLLDQGGLADHAFSTRLGGCSNGYLASLNTAFHTGDDEKNVLENRRRFFELFNYDYRDIVSSIQVHGTEAGLFDNASRGEGALPGSARRRCDALITTEPGLPLAAYSADCLLIYFLSLQKPLVAIAHAGWRGTLGGIGAKVIRCLRDLFGLADDRLLVALSPAVCRRCYKVDFGVVEKFQNAGWSGSAYLEPAGKGSWHLDLPAINTRQLLDAGIRIENLAGSGWCTACHPDLFYSYRRDRGLTGRMIGFISIIDHAGGRTV